MPQQKRRLIRTAQFGQDVWVFGEVFNEMRNGYFLDIGAHDGLHLSNTYLLEHRYQWKGLCVEANPESYAELRKQRKVPCVNVCLDATEGTVDFVKTPIVGGILSPETDNREANDNEVIRVETIPLDRLLKEQGVPEEIDYLSMDVEGAEERVFKTFDFQTYRCKCMTIERPSERLRKIFAQKGYLLIKDLPGLDCFYVHESFLDQYFENMSRFYEKRFLILS